MIVFLVLLEDPPFTLFVLEKSQSQHHMKHVCVSSTRTCGSFSQGMCSLTYSRDPHYSIQTRLGTTTTRSCLNKTNTTLRNKFNLEGLITSMVCTVETEDCFNEKCNQMSEGASHEHSHEQKRYRSR